MSIVKGVLILLLLPVALAMRLVRGRKPSTGSSGNQGSPEIPEEQRQMAASAAVAERLLCLGALQQRLRLELRFRNAENDDGGQADVRAKFDRLRDWAEGEGLLPKFTTEERFLLERPLGEWEQQDAIDVSWRNEGIAVLVWALAVGPAPPPYDTQVDGGDSDLPVLLPSAAFRRDARLRPEAELKAGRDAAELWLWRARTWRLMNEPQKEPVKLPEGMTFERIIELTAAKCGEDGLFQPVDRDFPALGKAYARLTKEEHSNLASIAKERLYAFNWLCGYAVDWDAVPTNT